MAMRGRTVKYPTLSYINIPNTVAVGYCKLQNVSHSYSSFRLCRKTAPQLVKKPHQNVEPGISLHFRNIRLWVVILRRLSPLILPEPTSLISILTLFCHFSLSLQNCKLPLVFPLKILYEFLFSATPLSSPHSSTFRSFICVRALGGL
jgi:hypothetical protein